MSKARNEPEELSRTRLTSKTRATGEDDVEGHGLRARMGPGEGLTSKTRITPGEGMTSKPRVTGEDDVEGHWMPDSGSSMRLAKARNSDIERDARQHQLANDARQARADHDPKRSHQKG